MIADTPGELLFPAPLSPDDAASYAALGSDAVWWESQGHWSRFKGPKAADALNGLITNDVVALAPGEGLHAAALSAKGKMIADMLVVRVDETEFLMTVLRSAADAWLSLARKYVNPRLCTVSDESAQFRSWMVYGTRAPEAVAMVGGGDATAENLTDGMVAALSEWPVWRHTMWNIGRASVRLIRAPLMGSRPGFILMAAADDAAHVQERFESAPLRRGTREVWDVCRVEAGRPAMRIDMDENTIPQEANLDALGAISFSKGCYTGQETVARVHFRGHVNRHLRGLVGSGPLPRGASVTTEEGKVVGDVRSSVISPRLGPIAMAMIRREVELGSSVNVETGGVPVQATVVALPFPSA